MIGTGGHWSFKLTNTYSHTTLPDRTLLLSSFVLVFVIVTSFTRSPSEDLPDTPRTHYLG